MGIDRNSFQDARHDSHSYCNATLKSSTLNSPVCDDAKSNRTVGSSKRKRKLPVQYLKRTGVDRVNTEQNEERFVKDEKDVEDIDVDDCLSKPAKYSILQADRKKAIVPSNVDPYPAYPDVDDETPRSVEPQPRTIICYKPAPDVDTKRPNVIEAKEKSKEHVADIVRKMQDFEEQSLTADSVLLDRDEKSSLPCKNSSFESQNNVPNVTISQTYNLHLFRRIAGKAQIKSRDMERQKKQFLMGGIGSQQHDADSSSAWLKWMMTSSQTQRNYLGEQLSQETTRAVSPINR